MIKEVFRQKNDPKDIKQMYDKIKLIIQPKAKTQYLIPGRSFIIPNKEWHKLQNKEINKDQPTLISDQQQLIKEYQEYLEDQLQPEKFIFKNTN